MKIMTTMKAGQRLDFCVLLTGTSTFGNSLEIAKQLKAAGIETDHQKDQIMNLVSRVQP